MTVSNNRTQQKALDLEKPCAEYVDGAYISAQKLAEAAAEGRELIGPAPASGGKNEGRFASEDFQVSVETRTAICPAGQASSQCSSLAEKATGRVSYRFVPHSATGSKIIGGLTLGLRNTVPFPLTAVAPDGYMPRAFGAEGGNVARLDGSVAWKKMRDMKVYTGSRTYGPLGALAAW